MSLEPYETIDEQCPGAAVLPDIAKAQAAPNGITDQASSMAWSAKLNELCAEQAIVCQVPVLRAQPRGPAADR
jgi:hypothetical protein